MLIRPGVKSLDYLPRKRWVKAGLKLFIQKINKIA